MITADSSLLIELAVITTGGFIAALVNAAFATGGIFIVLATSTAVFPLTVAVPMQSALAFGSLVARIVYFHKYIYWPIVVMFVAGCVIGVTTGANVFVIMPESAIGLLLGALLLVLIWAPDFQLPMADKKPFFLIGIAHSFIATVFGVGSLLQPVILRTRLLKLQITATLAVCMISMDVFKITAYVSHGFNYAAYLPHIVLATGAGFAGTYVGKRVEHRVSEQTFRRVFKWLITFVALRLLTRGAWQLYSGQ